MKFIAKPHNKENGKKGFHLLKKLGSGATAEVWEAKIGGKDVALKCFKKPVERLEEEKALNEVKYAEKVKNSFVASPIDYFVAKNDNKNVFCISYELAPNGALFDYLKKSGPLPSPILHFYSK